MVSPSERYRLREIEKLLHNQLHEAEEVSRLAEMKQLPQPELDRASEGLKLALERWRVFVTKATVPNDLKDWDGSGAPPNRS
jgi:hypothetical protein